MNKRFAMLRLPCSALRILKRLQHNSIVFSFAKEGKFSVNNFCNIYSNLLTY
ncbi:MAG: hypothetical protein LBH59_07010 [Planctomycetaceae bacterium]|nr:hypothetical protein [Planctomycetaceae bacterium]